MEYVKQYFFLLLFLGVALFNYLMARRSRRQAAESRAEQDRPAQSKPVLGKPSLHQQSAAGESRARPHRDRVAAPPPDVRTAADASRSLVTGRRNLRRAVIAMTILGPCRAERPHDHGR